MIVGHQGLMEAFKHRASSVFVCLKCKMRC